MVLFSFINGIWWGFLRRWFGGLFPDERYKILGSRGLQTIVMIISLLPVMIFQVSTSHSYFINYISDIVPEKYYLMIGIFLSLLLTLWLQFQFWSRGHGGTFADLGRDHEPDVSRYDRWFKKPLDAVWNWLLEMKEENKLFAFLLQRWSGRKYGYTYDMIYHTMRYTFPMLVPAILLENFYFILIGLSSAPIYELNIRMYERNEDLYIKKLSWLSSPNKLSEIELGFIFGLLTAI